MGKIMRYDVDYSSAAIAGVTGVKGGAESVYRRGNVDLTPENIGALAVGGDSADNTVSFETEDDLEPEEWTDVATLGSGETLKSIIGKISTMFKNIRYLKKTLVTLNTDIYTVTTRSLVVQSASRVYRSGVSANGVIGNIVICADGAWKSTDTIAVLPENLRPSAEQFINGDIVKDGVAAPAPFAIDTDGRIRQAYSQSAVTTVYIRGTYIIV